MRVRLYLPSHADAPLYHHHRPTNTSRWRKCLRGWRSERRSHLGIKSAGRPAFQRTGNRDVFSHVVSRSGIDAPSGSAPPKDILDDGTFCLERWSVKDQTVRIRQQNAKRMDRSKKQRYIRWGQFLSMSAGGHWKVQVHTEDWCLCVGNAPFRDNWATYKDKIFKQEKRRVNEYWDSRESAQRDC